MQKSTESDEKDILVSQKNTLTSKTKIQFSQKIKTFFYYRNYIICKSIGKVIAYNTLTKKTQVVTSPNDDFVITSYAPYLFGLMLGKRIRLYNEDAIGDENAVVVIKISKMEPHAICKYNNGLFLGGFNWGQLLGQGRTKKRQIYFHEKLELQANNKPNKKIEIKENQNPVELLQVQNPFLLAYCKPTFYIISLFSSEILLTFEKEFSKITILENRFAISTINGIGISKNNKIFTVDVEKFPLFGVQVSEHALDCNSICLQKTGRIFGCRGSAIFEYNPIKRHSICWMIYPENEKILYLTFTANNSLLALRISNNGKHIIEVYAID